MTAADGSDEPRLAGVWVLASWVTIRWACNFLRTFPIGPVMIAAAPSSRHPLRTVAALIVATSTLGGALFFGRADSDDARTPPLVLAAKGNLQWYKGNLHTHSLWSDGDDYLESIGLWYRDHDYQFLCYTDHNVLATTERWIDVEKSKGGRVAFDKLKARFPGEWVETRMKDDREEVRLKRFEEVSERLAEPGKFLLIQGEEISDSFLKRPIHMNASNVGEVIAPRHGTSVAETMQNNIDAVEAQRERTGRPIMIHLNHPNFGWGVTAEDMMRLRGEKFFEVYNGHPGVNNSGNAEHASTERIWDVLLTKRLGELGLPILFGLANDDGHNYHKIPSRASEPGRGWVVVLADELTPARLIAAMEAGRFYASSGVALERVETTARSMEVVVKAEPDVTYTVDFIGTKKGYDPDSQPVLDKDGKPLPDVTRRYSDDVGRVLKSVTGTSAKYEFGGDEIYVRARVTSSRKHPNPSEVGEFERAWVQPVVGPGA